jgi:hypothetical protein
MQGSKPQVAWGLWGGNLVRGSCLGHPACSDLYKKYTWELDFWGLCY